MAALSHREYRQLVKDAKTFARRAKAGRTYYVIVEVGGIKSGRRVSEVRFKRKFGVGLMTGSTSPEQLYLRHGMVYERREHPDIAGLLTWHEYNELEAKLDAEYLGSPGHYEAVGQLARGTAFRSTW